MSEQQYRVKIRYLADTLPEHEEHVLLFFREHPSASSVYQNDFQIGHFVAVLPHVTEPTKYREDYVEFYNYKSGEQIDLSHLQNPVAWVSLSVAQDVKMFLETHFPENREKS